MLEIWLFRCLIELHCETLSPFLEWWFSFIIFFKEMLFYRMQLHNFAMCLQTQQTWVWLGLSLAFNEPSHDRRRSSCFFVLSSRQSKIISFLIPQTHDMEFWGFKMLMLLKLYLFLSVVYWIFSSVFCSYLIQIQKINPVTFWNSVNIWPIWWEDVCYVHQLIEFCENCNPC